MHQVIQNYLSKVDNLSKLEPKNLPLDLLGAMSEMSEEELFKTCTQLFVLKSNIPTKNSIINLDEKDIIKGATSYAKDIIKRIKE